MARTSRIKTEDAMYHVMVRSISEVDLFKNNKDKDDYISIMKKYKNIYHFKVYAYCFMTNHAHFIIDSNGADISSIMHSIDFTYAQKFNKKYKRHGHLFQDRFKSKIINTDRYLLTVTGYIHNNPCSMKKYENCPEKYKYSSLGLYLGLRKDKDFLIDKDFLSKTFINESDETKEDYYRFVYICDNEKLKDEMEFANEKSEYESKRKILVRDFNLKDIMDYISEELGINKMCLYIKNSRKTVKARALAALFMRSFCNYKCSDICKVLGNITQSRVSELCSIAVNLINNDNKYKNITNKFILQYGS